MNEIKRQALLYAAQIAEECTRDDKHDEPFRIAATLRTISNMEPCTTITAREWYENNRDNFVTHCTGTGLCTRAEYDYPAMLEAFMTYCLIR